MDFLFRSYNVRIYIGIRINQKFVYNPTVIVTIGTIKQQYIIFCKFGQLHVLMYSIMYYRSLFLCLKVTFNTLSKVIGSWVKIPLNYHIIVLRDDTFRLKKKMKKQILTKINLIVFFFKLNLDLIGLITIFIGYCPLIV